MKRSIIALAALAASASFAAQAPAQGRHIRLGQKDGVPDRVRFVSQRVALSEGQATSWITLTRVGDFHDPRYGNFSITHQMLTEMVSNFDKRVLGQDVFIDVAHDPGDGAAARVLRLAVENGRLRALVEWTACKPAAEQVEARFTTTTAVGHHWLARLDVSYRAFAPITLRSGCLSSCSIRC